MFCDICGLNPIEEYHHCLVHRKKRYRDWTDDPVNMQPVCRNCHQKKANSYDNEQQWLEKQDPEAVADWLLRAPQKIRWGAEWKSLVHRVKQA